MRFRSAIAVLSQPPFLAPVSGLRPFEAVSEHGAISRKSVSSAGTVYRGWCAVLSGDALGGETVVFGSSLGPFCAASTNHKRRFSSGQGVGHGEPGERWYQLVLRGGEAARPVREQSDLARTPSFARTEENAETEYKRACRGTLCCGGQLIRCRWSTRWGGRLGSSARRTGLPPFFPCFLVGWVQHWREAGGACACALLCFFARDWSYAEGGSTFLAAVCRLFQKLFCVSARVSPLVVTGEARRSSKLRQVQNDQLECFAFRFLLDVLHF